MELRDPELVEALRRGEPRALDAVYRRHHERIWAFVARLAGRRELAEEIFQETWLALARHARRLPEDTALVPLLYTIARNAHRSARRFALFDRRRREGLAVEPAPATVAPDVHAEARARAAALARAFAELPDAHREVLLLCTVEHLEAAEAAAVLGVREDAVRKRLSRARAELARRLARQEAGPVRPPGRPGPRSDGETS